MAKFKLKAPYSIDPVPRYEVPFTPDNAGDDDGLVAKANKNGTMIVNKNIPKDSKLRKEAESHEDHHLKDMMHGKLDYDDDAVYHNLDGKGVKRVDRKNFDESNKNLPWEKEAYRAGDKMEEKDMRPKPNKLTGPPSMKDDTPLAFQKIGSRHKFGRTGDKNKVSANENFGPSMVKKFYGMSQKLSGVNEGATGPGGNSQSKKTPYSGSFVQFDPTTGKFLENQRVRSNERGDMGFNTKTITSDNFQGVGIDDTLKNAESYQQFMKNNEGADVDYNRKFTNSMKNVRDEYDDFTKNYATYRDRLKSGGKKGELKIPYGTRGGYLDVVPGQDYDSLGENTKERINNMKFVYTKVNKAGEVVPGGTTTLAKMAEEAKEMGGKNANASLISQSLFEQQRKDRASAYEKQSKALKQFQTDFPNVFKGTPTQERLKKAAVEKLNAEYRGPDGRIKGAHTNEINRKEAELKKKIAELENKKFDF